MNNFKERCKEAYLLPKKISEQFASTMVEQTCDNEIAKIWQLSFRDLRDYDLSEISEELFGKMTFSKDTVFPQEFRKYMDVEALWKCAQQNEDFGIREAHNLGITGKDRHIAVIDQGLHLNNKRFKDHVQIHKLSTDPFYSSDSMHANAIVDRVFALLPDVSIHFYPSVHTLAQRFEALQDIYQYNERCNSQDKIDVVSLSVALDYTSQGNENEWKEKLAEMRRKLLQEQNCEIIDSWYFGKYFMVSSPVYATGFTHVEDYVYGEEWVNHVLRKAKKEEVACWKKKNLNRTLVPGGGLLYAIPSDETEYVYTGSASYSWSIPQVACMLLIARTKHPELTYDEFAQLALVTGEKNKEGLTKIHIANML